MFESDLDEWSPQGPVTELSEAHSWSRLGSQALGRLALSVDDAPQIYPVNYASDGATVTFRTAAGAKLRELVHNRQVAFETDFADGDEAWSIVVNGTAEVLTTAADITAADVLPFPDWVPTRPYVYVKVTPSHLRGRHFDRRFRAGR